MMAKRKTVNGIPVPEGLTDAEYMKARRANNTLKKLFEMGKKPDQRWMRMVKESLTTYFVLGVMICQWGILLKSLQMLHL